MNAAKAADKTGVSFKAMGTSAQTATVATKALAMVGNMFVTALASLAVTAAIKGIEYLANYAELLIMYAKLLSYRHNGEKEVL